jgi:hypothetical protein
VRGQEGERAVRPARRLGDEHRALRFSSSGLLGSGQRQQQPGQEGRRSPTRTVAETRPRPRAGPRELAQPSMEIYFSVIQRKVLTPNELRRSWRGRGATARLRAPLRTERRSFRVEVDAQRPGVAHEEARRQARLPGSCLRSHRYVIEIAVQSTTALPMPVHDGAGRCLPRARPKRR